MASETKASEANAAGEAKVVEQRLYADMSRYPDLLLPSFQHDLNQMARALCVAFDLADIAIMASLMDFDHLQMPKEGDCAMNHYQYAASKGSVDRDPILSTASFLVFRNDPYDDEPYEYKDQIKQALACHRNHVKATYQRPDLYARRIAMALGIPIAQVPDCIDRLFK